MSHENWLNAARKYGAKQQTKQVAQKPAAATAVATERIPGSSAGEIADALYSFLRGSEGVAATTLLRASQQFVRLAEMNEGGGYGVVIFLDGDGLKESMEAMGMWTAYSKDVPKPNIKPVSEQDAAQIIVEASEGKATADKVISNLRADLDRIAARADE